MAQFWTASAVTTTSGSAFISVQTGDDVALISPNSFLQVGNAQFVEVKTVNTSANPQTIELFVPWNAATASGQSAIAAPTKAEIKAAADEIRALRVTYEGIAGNISTTATADTIVQRDANGRIKAADPVAAEDLVTINALQTGLVNNPIFNGELRADGAYITPDSNFMVIQGGTNDNLSSGLNIYPNWGNTGNDKLASEISFFGADNDTTNAFDAFASIKARTTNWTANGDIGGSITFETSSANSLVERMRIDSVGNVGIGTINPRTLLTIGDCEDSVVINDGVLALKSKSTNTALVIQEEAGAEQWGLGVNANGDLLFNNSGLGVDVTFTDEGNVGIGTTTPTADLDIRTGSNEPKLRLGSNTNEGNLLWNNSAGTFDIGTAGASDWTIRFLQNANERMRISTTGHVGIGTNSPARRLSVLSQSGDNVPVRVQSGATTTNCFIDIKDSTTTADFKVRLGSQGDQLVAWAGGAERMRISSTGIITNPNSASQTDTTVNRLLKVADFGIGAPSMGVETDLDTASYGGLSRYNDTTLNTPLSNSYGTVLTIVRKNDEMSQFAQDIVTSKAFIRRRNSGGWSTWSEIAHADNNALIEEGSNANGSYTKFPDGTLICRQEIISVSTGDKTWTYPLSFISIPTPQATPRNNGTVPYTSVFTTIGTSSLTFKSFNTSNSGQGNIQTNIIAIGRWK